MMTAPSSLSPQTTARVSGALWLIVIAMSIIAIVVNPPFDAATSAAEVAAKVLAGEQRFRISFAALVVASVCYIGVTALIYELLHPVDTRIALFGAFAGLIGLAIGGATSVHQMNALAMLEEAATLAPASARELQTLAAASLRPGADFSIGMVYFGCQIASIGYLILRSRLVPRVIGGTLLLGGSSYIVTSFAMFVAPEFGARLSPLVIPIAILGEGSLTLWLLFKGVRLSPVERRAAETPRPSGS